jgi:hypothetical protein
MLFNGREVADSLIVADLARWPVLQQALLPRNLFDDLN